MRCHVTKPPKLLTNVQIFEDSEALPTFDFFPKHSNLHDHVNASANNRQQTGGGITLSGGSSGRPFVVRLLTYLHQIHRIRRIHRSCQWNNYDGTSKHRLSPYNAH